MTYYVVVLSSVAIRHIMSSANLITRVEPDQWQIQALTQQLASDNVGINRRFKP